MLRGPSQFGRCHCGEHVKLTLRDTPDLARLFRSRFSGFLQSEIRREAMEQLRDTRRRFRNPSFGVGFKAKLDESESEPDRGMKGYVGDGLSTSRMAAPSHGRADA